MHLYIEQDMHYIRLTRQYRKKYKQRTEWKNKNTRENQRKKKPL